MGSPCTWGQVLANFPNSSIHPTLGGVGLKAGSGWPAGFDGNADALTIGVSGVDTTYDFEPETACTSVCYADAVNGNDAFGGTAAAPKASIQAAIDAVDPGGEVRVLPGSYSETAANRTLTSIGGVYDFGLFFADAKGAVTVQGVTAGDVAITDPTAVQAYVETNATNNFGPSGVFVEGDGVTISGIEIGTNSAGQNKTVEVIGDDFHLLHSSVNDPQGSVYINDFRYDSGSDTSHVQAYTIDDNIFADGASIDLASGAGRSGPVSGRQITGNEFTNNYSWPSISFNGAGTGVEWFVYNVGGAEITGNTFHAAELYIRARGDYPNAEFDWQSYWDDNTYAKAVVVGPNPPADLRTYSYTSGTYTFNHVREVGGLIQPEVDHAQAGDTVLVKEGTYPEQVSIAESIHLLGESGAGSTTIDAPATIPAASDPNSTIVKVAGSGVDAEIAGFTIAGPGPTGCGSIGAGIFVRDGAHADIHDNHLLDIRDQPFSGCQNGVAILVGRDSQSTTGTADITNNIIDGYQKNGITVDGAGSDAVISGNVLTGAGPTTVTAQNGIQISRGATAFIRDNTVSGNDYTPESWAACGLLFYQADGVKKQANQIFDNEFNLCNVGRGGGGYNPTN